MMATWFTGAQGMKHQYQRGVATLWRRRGMCTLRVVLPRGDVLEVDHIIPREEWGRKDDKKPSDTTQTLQSRKTTEGMVGGSAWQTPIYWGVRVKSKSGLKTRTGDQSHEFNLQESDLAMPFSGVVPVSDRRANAPGTIWFWYVLESRRNFSSGRCWRDWTWLLSPRWWRQTAVPLRRRRNILIDGLDRFGRQTTALSTTVWRCMKVPEEYVILKVLSLW